MRTRRWTAFFLHQRLGLIGRTTRGCVVGLWMLLSITACLRRTPPPTTLPSGSQAAGTPEGQAPGPGAAQAGKNKIRVQVSAGAGHSCALVADGRIYCWGDNQFGQLGDGTQRSRQGAAPVSGPRQLVAISSGNAHACAIDHKAQLWCWGDNRFGQLGLGAGSLKRAFVPRPTRVPGLTDGVRSIVSGGQHSCAVTRNNDVYCWGDNAHGQLGQAAPAVFAQPALVQGVGVVKQLALGRAHSCAQRSDQVVLCWGDNRQGQLGTKLPQSRYRPARLSGLAAVDHIAAGGDRTCAASGAGVMCWGRGTGSGPGHVLKRVANLGRVRQLSVGTTSACLIDADQRPYCWGRNDEGQLGDASTRDSAAPRPLAGLRQAIALSVGPRHSCAADPRGKVYCWGSDGYAALGATPNQVPASGEQLRRTLMLQPSRKVAAGRKFACSVSDTGSVYCWGDNSKGQLGNGSKVAYSARPVRVSGIDDATSVVAGAQHACALRRTGHLKCWGSNLARQIGDPRLRKPVVRTPVTVTQIRDVVDLAAGDAFSCAVNKQGQVWCWGASVRGQLGHVSGGFAPVSGISGAQRVFAGAEHACARDRSGSLFCWGDNRKGQLGTNAGARGLDKPVPRAVRVRGINRVGEVALGDTFSCAVSGDRRVYCWGDNRAGQIGNGTASDVWMMPVPVSSLRQVSVLGAGSTHACAGQGDWVYCWGRVPPGGSVGPEGMDARKPVRSVALAAQQLSAGDGFSCGRERDGEVACWGKERAGELGRGMRGFSTRALLVNGL